MKLLVSLLLCSTIAVPAWALSDPKASNQDALDRTVDYDPHNRVLITIEAGGLAVISVSPMESIEQVVKLKDAPFGYPCENSGSDKKDCDTSYSNNLPLIGEKVGAGDLVILTRGAPPNDKERTYLFRVKVADRVDDPQVAATLTKHLTFRYSPSETAAAAGGPPAAPVGVPRQLTWQERKAKHDAEVMQAKLRADVTFGPQNMRYLAQGKARALAPLAAFDNGTLTAFRYPGNMQTPAVFKVLDNHQGTPEACIPGGRATRDELEAPEQEENSRSVNDLVVVDETAPHWRLRSGEDVVDVWNCAYDPIGNNPETGTGVPDVTRRIISP